jgi:hypothetical protein
MRGRRKGRAVKLLAEHAGNFEAQLGLCVDGWRSVDPNHAEIFRLVSSIRTAEGAARLPTQPIKTAISISADTFDKMTAALDKAKARLAEIVLKAVADGDTATIRHIAEALDAVADEVVADHFRLLILLVVEDADFMGQPRPTLSELIQIVSANLPDVKDERDYRRALKELGIKLPASTKKRGPSENRKLA